MRPNAILAVLKARDVFKFTSKYLMAGANIGSICATTCIYVRGTQRQFSENICSEDDLRSRIFRTFVVKFLARLSLLGFPNNQKWCNCPFLTDFYLKRSPRIFGSLFLAEIFEKVSFDPYNFRITRLSARKSEQMKNVRG